MDLSTLPDDDFLETYLAGVGALPTLPEWETAALERRMDSDPAARRVVESQYLAAVVEAARPFFGRGISAHDVVQEGNVALSRALERFDPDVQDVPFDAYLRLWVRQAVVRLFGERGIEPPDLPAE